MGSKISMCQSGFTLNVIDSIIIIKIEKSILQQHTRTAEIKWVRKTTRATNATRAAIRIKTSSSPQRRPLPRRGLMKTNRGRGNWSPKSREFCKPRILLLVVCQKMSLILSENHHSWGSSLKMSMA